MGGIIARSSHDADYDGLVDVLPTQGNIFPKNEESREEIQRKIATAQEGINRLNAAREALKDRQAQTEDELQNLVDLQDTYDHNLKAASANLQQLQSRAERGSWDEKIIADMRRMLASAEIMDYTRKEGSPYNPDEALIAFSPHLRGDRWTVTEHPHEKRIVFVDRSYPIFDGGEWIHRPYTFEDSRILDSLFETTGGAKTAYEVSRRVREAILLHGILPEGDALQYEMIESPQGMKVVQVRKFADYRESDWKLDEDAATTDISDRVFGITPPEGIVLPVARGNFRSDALRKGDRLNERFLAAPRCVSDPLSLSDFSPRMQGYLPVEDSFVNPALSHQHTRFVQWALKNSGVASLMPSNTRVARLLDREIPVCIICDGIRMQIRET